MSHAEPPRHESEPARRSSRPFLTLAILALLGGALYIAFNGPGTEKAVESVPLLGKVAGIARGNAPAPPAKPAEGAARPATAGGGGQQGGGGGGRPGVSILAAEAQQKTIAVRFDGFGAVQPMAQVTLRSRVDSQIDSVAVQDGMLVKAGDLLFKLDDRQILAQIKQTEANMARNRATLDGAQRDVSRIAELVARDASARKLLDDARTKAAELTAQTKADEATLENLKVQLGFTEIRAPISGRFGMAGLKAGAIVRQGEATSTLGTIVQTSPIYVAFGLPQRLLGDLRLAMVSGKPSVVITGNGINGQAEGAVAFLDNTVDQATGMIMTRALLENSGETLWPGALVNVRLTIRDEQQVTVPASAVQAGQSGAYVFVIKDNKAQSRPVEVARTQDGEAIIAKGLQAGETVAVDGQLNLTNGAGVTIRKPQSPQTKPGA